MAASLVDQQCKKTMNVDVRGMQAVTLKLGVHSADMDLQRVLPHKHMVRGVWKVWEQPHILAIRNTIAKLAEICDHDPLRVTCKFATSSPGKPKGGFCCMQMRVSCSSLREIGKRPVCKQIGTLNLAQYHQMH